MCTYYAYGSKKKVTPSSASWSLYAWVVMQKCQSKRPTWSDGTTSTLSTPAIVERKKEHTCFLPLPLLALTMLWALPSTSPSLSSLDSSTSIGDDSLPSLSAISSMPSLAFSTRVSCSTLSTTFLVSIKAVVASNSDSSREQFSLVGITKRVCVTPNSASACVTLGAMVALGMGSLKLRRWTGT